MVARARGRGSREGGAGSKKGVEGGEGGQEGLWTSMDVEVGYWQFHPRFYLEVFEEIRVKTVVRLNAPNYDPKFFEVLLVEGGREE